MKWLDGITDSMDVSLSELRVLVTPGRLSDRRALCAWPKVRWEGRRGGVSQHGLSQWPLKRLWGPEDGGDGGVGGITGRNSRSERIRHEAGEQALSKGGVWMANGDRPPRPGVRVCRQGRIVGVMQRGGSVQTPTLCTPCSIWM